jgi:hypothetical protein
MAYYDRGSRRSSQPPSFAPSASAASSGRRIAKYVSSPPQATSSAGPPPASPAASAARTCIGHTVKHSPMGAAPQPGSINKHVVNQMREGFGLKVSSSRPTAAQRDAAAAAAAAACSAASHSVKGAGDSRAVNHGGSMFMSSDGVIALGEVAAGREAALTHTAENGSVLQNQVVHVASLNVASGSELVGRERASGGVVAHARVREWEGKRQWDGIGNRMMVPEEGPEKRQHSEAVHVLENMKCAKVDEEKEEGEVSDD